ncbi:hypothetical protein MLD38_004880 [Melastoma candidum]|uniref:Uncharacterized protein n=1 Tax=Melastoma candidum TaxID=119954 RepID=A0ACB9S6Z9_9MYRT|nr:hypothetical protein MLD38_004880 [Melastoma candidum]
MPVRLVSGTSKDIGSPPWRRAFPHVVVASFSSFLFGYHLSVVNETLESISVALSFNGNTMAEGRGIIPLPCVFIYEVSSLSFDEGLVVSTCLAGAFIGSVLSGMIADGVGRRRFALPMIIGALMSAMTNDLWGMLIGRLFVGTGMGLGPPVAALYVSEVSPTNVRGTFGSLLQIATCLGLMASLFIGISAKDTVGWWRVCFGVSVIPAAALAILMDFCAESSLASEGQYFIGRAAEAEFVFEKLLGGVYVKSAIAELTKSTKGEETDSVHLSELISGRHFRMVFVGAGVPSDIANICVELVNLSGSIGAMILMDKLGRKALLLGSFSGMRKHRPKDKCP